jgi:hypothetical protein
MELVIKAIDFPLIDLPHFGSTAVQVLESMHCSEFFQLLSSRPQLNVFAKLARPAQARAARSMKRIAALGSLATKPLKHAPFSQIEMELLWASAGDEEVYRGHDPED